MKCKRCQASNPKGSRACWACGVNLREERSRQMAFRPEAMRHYRTSVAAIDSHRAWLDGIVLLSTILFGLLLGYFLIDVLPKSGAGGTLASASTGTSAFKLPAPLSFLSPAAETRAAVPFGQAQEVSGVVAQAAGARRSKGEGGRQASAGTEFLAATFVIDNQGKTALNYSLSDLKARDSKGRIHNAENIRGAGWLSGGSVEPGQRVMGTIAFLVPEGDPQPQVTFTPKDLHVMLRWDVPAAG